jgi:hypothetical protein
MGFAHDRGLRVFFEWMLVESGRFGNLYSAAQRQYGEGIGEIGIEEEMMPVPFEKEPALAEPRDVEGVRGGLRLADVVDEGGVFL